MDGLFIIKTKCLLDDTHKVLGHRDHHALASLFSLSKASKYLATVQFIYPVIMQCDLFNAQDNLITLLNRLTFVSISRCKVRPTSQTYPLLWVVFVRYVDYSILQFDQIR